MCDVATSECEQPLLDMVELLTISENISELNEFQKDTRLAQAMTFVRAVGDELMDSHDLTYRG